MKCVSTDKSAAFAQLFNKPTEINFSLLLLTPEKDSNSCLNIEHRGCTDSLYT